MPAIVIPNPEAQPSFVADRSNHEISFFRVKSTDIPQQLYPGDSEIVMAIPYYVDNTIYYEWHMYRMFDRSNRKDLFQQPVTATLYRYDCQPVRVERCFAELQIF